MSDEALLKTLLDQEARLQFDSFDFDDAFALGMALVERGRRESLPIVIDATRAQHQLFHVALPGTSADNDHWVRRKNNLVYRFGHSSYYIGRLCNSDAAAFAAKFLLDPKDYAPHGGAFPVFVRRVGLIGTITVSGLPQVEDHRLAVEEIERFLKR